MTQKRSKDKRPGWDEYFMGVARAAARRSTCDRAQVGAVIDNDNQILSTGYNGSPTGQPHCFDVGHLMEDGHCIRTIHGEMNAVLMAARFGVAIKGAKIYVTHFPCYYCMKSLINAGIKEVCYAQAYRIDKRVKDMARRARARLRRVKEP